jgi:hypothetical protein
MDKFTVKIKETDKMDSHRRSPKRCVLASYVKDDSLNVATDFSDIWYLLILAKIKSVDI